MKRLGWNVLECRKPEALTSGFLSIPTRIRTAVL